MKKKTKRPRRLRVASAGTPYLLGIIVVLLVLFLTGRLKFKGTDESMRDNLVVKGPQTLKIDVPTRQVYKGEKLADVPLTSLEWPSGNGISSFATSRAQLSGKYATSQLSAYAPIPLNSLVDSSSEANAVVENIPQGYRAISVKVDVESSVEGWAQPGNFVDVIVLRQSPDPELGIEAKVISENVKILSTGSSVEQSSQGSSAVRPPPTVTLLVSAEDALKIRAASTLGKLTFSLRGVGDDSRGAATSINQRTILGGSRSVDPQLKERFKGQARGPDGKLYVLDSDSRWVKDLKEVTVKGVD